jgi:hypothetical protein
MRTIAIVLLGASLGCGRLTTAANDVTPSDANTQQSDMTVTRGALTLSLHDFATRGGIFWALPNAQTGPGTITVESTRYGSLCRYAVDGSATTSAKSVTIDITFTPRTAACTTDIRALTYKATLAIAPGAYDLAVVHHENGGSDTLVRRAVTVP